MLRTWWGGVIDAFVSLSESLMTEQPGYGKVTQAIEHHNIL